MNSRTFFNFHFVLKFKDSKNTRLNKGFAIGPIYLKNGIINTRIVIYLRYVLYVGRKTT